MFVFFEKLAYLLLACSAAVEVRNDVGYFVCDLRLQRKSVVCVYKLCLYIYNVCIFTGKSQLPSEYKTAQDGGAEDG